MANPSNEKALEPRVATLEAGLSRLTEDVRDLASVVRNQGSATEREIQKLVVAVTQASAPKKVDWMTIITGLMLVMSIGAAVFWPLNQASENNKAALLGIGQRLEEHMKSDSDLTIASRVQALEAARAAQARIEQNELEMWRLRALTNR